MNLFGYSINLGVLLEKVSPFLLAILILVGGLIAAKIVAVLLGKALSKAKIISKMLKKIGVEVDMKKFAKITSKIVFIIIALFVIVAFFDKLGIEAIRTPINDFMLTVLPGMLGATGLAIVAWISASLARFGINKIGGTLDLDSKLKNEVTDGNLTESISTITYWFIIVFFLPAILGQLGQEELLAPITDIISQITGYIPNIIGAGVILVIGWFIAKTLRTITTSVLTSIGADKTTQKLGLTDFSISKVAGSIVYVIILLPILIQALDELAIDAVSGPAKEMLNTIMNTLPNIFAATVIVGISYVIAKFISKLVTELLSGIGFDKVLGLIGLNSNSKTTPSTMVGTLVFVYILLLATIEAANQIGFVGVSEIVNQFMGFATNVLVGVVIFGIGMFLANLASNTIKSTSNSKFLPKIAKGAIIILTSFMGLQQMGLGGEIINQAFTLLLGACAVAFALAVGLGSKEVAGEEVKKIIDNMKK